MTFHDLFNRHSADLKASRWEHGRFVTDCLECDREMVKPPSGSWRLSTSLELAERHLERSQR